MKSPLYLVLWLICSTSCKEQNSKKPLVEHQQSITEKTIQVPEQLATTAAPEIPFDINEHLLKYEKLKKRIAQKRSDIATQSNSTIQEKQELAEQYVSTILIDSIFEYWEGTKWDFNGYTETPRKGVVACGYYVSTTLRDIGLKINRFKVAQKSATDIIKALCDLNSIQTFNGFSSAKEHLKELATNEIVVVGLDFHVGFVFKQNDELYFAHSNYIDSEGVMKEILNDSEAFKNSEYYVVGKLTKNPNFLVKWLENN